MKMKKFILSLGLIATAFGLTNCTKNEEVTPVVETKGDFAIYASTETRTANDDLNTVWATGDDLGVFHAVTDGTTYAKDGQFKLEDVASGKFLGSVNGTLDPQEEYDWYAMYPYVSQVPGPNNTSSGYTTIGCSASATQTQTGNNSMAHIAGKNFPLVGKAYAVPANQSPALAMTHVATLLEFEVTNSLNEPITVSNIKFTAPEYLVGTFYIDFDDIDNITVKTSGSSYTSKAATLVVKNGEAIEAGESAKFYLPVAPFTANANAKLAIEVNVTSGEKVGMLAKDITLANETAFNAGKIRNIKVNYDAEFVEEGLALPFSDDFSWVKDAESTELLNSDLSDNYSSATKVYGSGGELKFGTSSIRGSLTTKPFNLSEPFTVVVDAKAWSGDSSNLKVTVNGVSKTTANLTDNYKKYMFEFDAATAASTIQFDITGKRGYIDNLEIIPGHDYVLPPVLTINPEALTFEYAANSKTITCSIENEVSGASITATENVDWLSTSVSGNTVTVTATENTGADRETTITIAYGSVNKVVAVKQLAKPAEGSVEVTESMNIYANMGTLANNVITWTGANFTFSNAKGLSTTAIRNSDSDHYRIYAKSNITLTAHSGKKFKKVVFTCTSSDYATVLKNTLGSSASESGTTVTWTGSADTITAQATAQTRVKKIVATLQ